MSDSKAISDEFLEIASQQRLNILLNLSKEKSNLSSIAKRLGATSAEVHRNLNRLQNAGFIKKRSDGDYELTLYGKTVCAQIPTLGFMSKNKRYFETHEFSDLPTKYVQRIGALVESELVTGYVKVMEKCEEMYKNANEYIYNILIEIPYNEKLLEILESKLNKKTRISSIFSEAAIISKERQELVAKFDFGKHVKAGTLDRKMKKDVKIALVLNEKEAGVSFPSSTGEPDMSKMFYSIAEPFHEWCLDLFNESWKTATAFQEAKLTKC